MWGFERFHQYIFGRKVTVHSKHKPLQTIIKQATGQSTMETSRNAYVKAKLITSSSCGNLASNKLSLIPCLELSIQKAVVMEKR